MFPTRFLHLAPFLNTKLRPLLQNRLTAGSCTTRKATSRVLASRPSPNTSLDVVTKFIDALVEKQTLEVKSETLAMVLKNLRAHQIPIHEVAAMLSKVGVSVSFSNVTWKDVAGLVGLDPTQRLMDVETFPVYRAALPQSTHDQIIQGLYLCALQYGTPAEHETEQATVNFLAPMFNQIVGLFDSHIENLPNHPLNGRLASKGRIEYLYSAFGKILVVFIEVQLFEGGSNENLNHIAQVICETDACDLANHIQGISCPVYGILCDGARFRFFQFQGTDSIDKPSESLPKFRCSEFIFKENNHSRYLSLPAHDGDLAGDFREKIVEISESIFYLFLTSYSAALEIQWQLAKREADASTDQNHADGWLQAKEKVEEALKLAVNCENDRDAETATQLLLESHDLVPNRRLRAAFYEMFWGKPKELPSIS